MCYKWNLNFQKQVAMDNFVKDMDIREIMVGGEKRMVGTAPVILDGLKGCVQVKYRIRTKLYHLGQKN